MAHRRAKLTSLGRRLLVDRILIDGMAVAHAADMVGVSRQTAWRWRCGGSSCPATLVLFGVQENIEYLAAHGDVIGIEALVGPYAPLAIPVLALVTLALAAIGGLVRWRIAVLEARIARSLSRARYLLDHLAPPPEWRTIHAAAPASLDASPSRCGPSPAPDPPRLTLEVPRDLDPDAPASAGTRRYPCPVHAWGGASPPCSAHSRS